MHVILNFFLYLGYMWNPAEIPILGTIFIVQLHRNALLWYGDNMSTLIVSLHIRISFSKFGSILEIDNQIKKKGYTSKLRKQHLLLTLRQFFFEKVAKSNLKLSNL